MFSKRRVIVSGLQKCRAFRRLFHESPHRCKFNQPLSGHEMPRAGGIASMMRLPLQNTTEGKGNTNENIDNQSRW